VRFLAAAIAPHNRVLNGISGRLHKNRLADSILYHHGAIRADFDCQRYQTLNVRDPGHLWVNRVLRAQPGKRGSRLLANRCLDQ
jgi:hypothetical protein